MHDHLKRHTHSFHFAIQGIVHAFLNEPNFAIHIGISLITIILGLFLRIPKYEFMLVVILITMGLAAELANTAIEEITDLVTKEHRIEAKIAKDVAAGMMLIVAIGASVVGLLIYIPYILNYFTRL